MKARILLVLWCVMVLFSSRLKAQNLNLTWAKGMGSANVETTFSVKVDAVGNVYTTGYFLGTVDFDPNAGVANLTSAGQTDIFISKLDANGNFIWVKSMGGTGFDEARSIALDDAGNIYTTGYFQGIADFNPNAGVANLTSTGIIDIFISKLDASGNFIWAKNMGGTGDGVGFSITLDAAGNVYTTGYFVGIVDFDPNAGVANLISNGGQTDIFISKLDANGNFIWAKNMGGTGQDFGYAIAVDVTGNVYTTGYFRSIADFDPNAGVVNLTSAGNDDIFISKLDANGNFVWAKRMGAGGFDYGLSIVVDVAGSIYTTGYFSGVADFDPNAGVVNLTSAGFDDIFISKLDASGNLIWAKNMGGTNSDYGNGIALDAAGNVYTTGSFQGTADFDPNAGVANLTSAGSNDIFISKLDASGNFIGARNMGGADFDRSNSIALDATSNVYITGSFENVADLDPNAGVDFLTSVGLSDIFVAKYTQCPTITINPATLPAGVVGTFYSQTITQTGLAGVPTWSVISGSLPNGVSITPTTGVISGAPTTAGSFTFTVSVTDGSCTQTRVYTIVVNCPPIAFLNTTINIGGEVGTAFTLNAGATGSTQPLTYTVSPALPLGLNLNATSGLITGTPTTATGGFLNCTITATQGNCNITRVLSFFVTCPITTFTISIYTNAVVGTAYSFYISASVFGNTQPVTYTVSPTLPIGFNLNSTTGLISGTPTTPTASANYIVTATQGTCSVTNNYIFSVLCPALTFTSAAVTNGTVGLAYTLDGSLTSSVGVIYSVAPTLPAGLNIDTATGIISGTPTAAATLTTYTVTATKGTCIATRGYAFSVACPTLSLTSALAPSATVGTPYTFNAVATGSTGTLVYSVSPALPLGLNINPTNGTISGTPTTATASATYTVTVAQGTCTATRAYTFLVACAGISINPATLPNGTIGATYNQTVVQTGLLATPTWSVSTGNLLPAGLSLASGTGIISGTPTAVVTSTFTVVVTDGTCSQTRTYTVITACPNIVFTNTTANLAIINTPYSLSAGVTGNNATVTYSILPATLPAGLSFNTTTGLISGTPTAITPSATYIVTASQSAGTCVVTQAYTFAVTNCLPFGIAPNTNFLPDGNVGIPYLGVTFTAENALAGATYTFRQVGGVSLTTLGLSLNTATGTISGTPDFSSSINMVIVATNNATGCPSTPKSYTLVVYPNPATSIDNSLDNVVKVSPNPSSNDFNVDFGNLNMAKSLVRVYDAQGKVVFTSENNSNLMTISLRDFANGIYLMEVQTEKGRVIKRLAKQ